MRGGNGAEEEEEKEEQQERGVEEGEIGRGSMAMKREKKRGVRLRKKTFIEGEGRGRGKRKKMWTLDRLQQIRQT